MARIVSITNCYDCPFGARFQENAPGADTLAESYTGNVVIRCTKLHRDVATFSPSDSGGAIRKKARIPRACPLPVKTKNS